MQRQTQKHKSLNFKGVEREYSKRTTIAMAHKNWFQNIIQSYQEHLPPRQEFIKYISSHTNQQKVEQQQQEGDPQIQQQYENDKEEEKQNTNVQTLQKKKKLQGDTLVCVRIRPLLQNELEKKYFSTQICNNPLVHFLEVKQNYAKQPELIAREYPVDLAFGPEDDNETVYNQVGERGIDVVLRGGVSIYLAYGQTGSGKTYSMRGITEGIAKDIFVKNSKNKKIFVSFLEILADVTDLLAGKAQVKITGGFPGQGRKVNYTGLSEHEVSNQEDLMAKIDKALKQRATVSTFSNQAGSSRSVAILRLRIENPQDPKDEGEMFLVDMPGSEYLSDYQFHSQEQMWDTTMINSTINELKRTMINKARAQLNPGKNIHINQSTFPLLKIINPAFDISCKREKAIVFIGTISPSILDIAQTKNTLDYCEPFKIGGGGRLSKVKVESTKMAPPRHSFQKKK